MRARQAAETVRRQEMTRARVYHRALPGRGERRRWQRHREDLVRAERVVVAGGAIDDVATVSEPLAPEPFEAGRRAHGHRVPLAGGTPERAREPGEGGERVEPQRVHLDGLADAWRDHVVADLRVHPRELHARLAGTQETVGGIHRDAVPRSVAMPRHDRFERRVQLFQQPVVSGRGVMGADRLHVPQGRIDRVVLRRVAAVGEPVRQETAVDDPCERAQHGGADLRPPGYVPTPATPEKPLSRSVVQPCSGKPGKRLRWKENSTSTRIGALRNAST